MSNNDTLATDSEDGIVAYTLVDGVVHGVKWSLDDDDIELLYACTERRLGPGNIWNPNHPLNVHKPKYLTCMGCIAEEA